MKINLVDNVFDDIKFMFNEEFNIEINEENVDNDLWFTLEEILFFDLQDAMGELNDSLNE